VIDEFAKEYLHGDLRWIREVLLWKLDGLSDYDIRRPLTATGTNLLGLVKHLATWEARYFGEVFGRPFPEHRGRRGRAAPTPGHRAGDPRRSSASTGAQGSTRRHDSALPIDAPGHVPWWPVPT
jgi:hypothetical protein